MSSSTATFANPNIALTNFRAATVGPLPIENYIKNMDVGYFRAANYIVGGLTSMAVLFGVGTYDTITSPRGSAATAELFEPLIIRSALPAAFREAQQELDSFRNFEDGWDGVGSVRPIPELIDAAAAFLNFLPASAIAPEASASADGNVSWFWDNEDFYATVSFSKVGKYAYFAKDKRTGQKAGGLSETFLNEIPEDFLDFITVA